MNMVEVKTSELTGTALDWVIASIEKIEIDLFRKIEGHLVPRYCPVMFWEDFSPSTEWPQGGYLIEKYKVNIYQQSKDGISAVINDDTNEADYDGSKYIGADGETVLIAVCRAIVLSELGQSVYVPADLLGDE